MELGGQKQRALLAMLLLHANEVVSTDRLIDALWEDDPPARAQKAVQVYVSGLRKVIGPGRIETKAPGYLVRAADDELDAARFEAFVAQGAFRDALALWRGPALGDFVVRALRRDGDRTARGAATLRARGTDRAGSGRWSPSRGCRRARGPGRANTPCGSACSAQLMLALYRSGRQADALEAYQRRCAGRSVTSWAWNRAGSCANFEQAILRHDPALDHAVPLASPDDSPRGIFVGRERELAELLEGLDDALAGHGRLFLLRGEPGIGKSRLADEVVVRARSRGAQVLVGRSWEAGGAPAYWPWVQALRAYIESATAEVLRSDLGGHGDYLAQLLPELRELRCRSWPSLLLSSRRARGSDSSRRHCCC